MVCVWGVSGCVQGVYEWACVYGVCVCVRACVCVCVCVLVCVLLCAWVYDHYGYFKPTLPQMNCVNYSL